MTGLKPESDLIIEIATIVTDKTTSTCSRRAVLAVRQSEATLNAMDDWNRRQHGNSGLAARVLASDVDAAAAEIATLKVLEAGAEPGRIAHVRQQHLSVSTASWRGSCRGSRAFFTTGIST